MDTVAIAPKCGKQYAGGLVDRWCDRTKGHEGTHSGNLDALFVDCDTITEYDMTQRLSFQIRVF